MRLVILDTETTGLKVEEGHRVIEIGCVEVVNRQPTGQSLHVFLNPEREIDEGATAIHGMTWDHLKDKPLFAQVAHELVEFIAGAQLVIHNAPFDLGFLNEELRRVGQGPIESHVAAITDSLAFARELHPGQRNSLDALCQRYAVDNRERKLHGALLDAQILGEVYLAMTRGQESLAIAAEEDRDAGDETELGLSLGDIVVRRAGPDEIEAHRAVLAQIDQSSNGRTLWKSLDRAQVT